MHLSPEQIDRQPFRMRRRGYDVVEVRNFLREIAEEMRARDEVRRRLADDGDPEEVAGTKARELVERAEAEAESIIEAARSAVRDRADVEVREAADIVTAAHEEAATILDSAERAARERSAAVLAETQSRLDRLLAEEREIHRARAARDDRSRDEPTEAEQAPVPDDVELDTTLASFMKDTLRNEITPDQH